MPDNYKISDLTTAATLKDSDLFELAQENQNISGGLESLKTTMIAIATYIATIATYSSSLDTTNKTLAGAINELKRLISLIPTFNIKVVNALPTEDISETTLYLVPSSNPETGNSYDEYIYVSNNWELVGSTAIDLSAYYTKLEVDGLLANKVDKVSGKGLSTNDFVNNSKYPDLTAGKSLSLVTKSYDVSGSDSAPYVYRQFPASADGAVVEKLKKLTGASVVWNQLSTNTTDVTITSGHKYIHWNGSTLTKATSDGTAISVVGGTDKIYDISAMFGNDTVATAITTAKFAELFPNYASYAYSANTIQSVSLSGHKVVGKNLLPNANWTDGYYFGSSGQLVENEYLSVSDYEEVKGNTQYIYSGTNLHKGSESQNVYIQVCFYDKNKTFIERNKNIQTGNVTFTTTSTTKYVRVSKGMLASDLQIELGSTATAFEPYHTETTALDHTTLRGLFKLDANNNLYANGDIYPSDGSGSVKYAEVDLGSLEWISAGTDTSGLYRYESNGIVNDVKLATRNLISTYPIGENNNHTNGVQELIVHPVNKSIVVWSDKSTVQSFKTAMNGEKLIYEKATPTTATLTPFNPLSVIEQGGTEEFFDYGVQQGTRDVAIPVGTDTDFYEEVETEMPLPNVPFEDGEYKLTATVDDHEAEFEWKENTDITIPLKMVTAIVRPKPGETNGDHIQISTDGGTTFEEYYYNDMNGQSNAKNLPPFFRIWYSSPYWNIQARTYTELDGVYYFPQETVMVQEYDSMYQFEISGIVFGN